MDIQNTLNARTIDWIQWGRRHFFLGPLGLHNKISLKLHVSHLLPRLPAILKNETDTYRYHFTLRQIASLINPLHDTTDVLNASYIDGFHRQVVKKINTADILYTLADGFEIMTNVTANFKIHDQVACNLWHSEIRNKYSKSKINLDGLYEREKRLFDAVNLVICPSGVVQDYVKSIAQNVPTTIVRYPVKAVRGVASTKIRSDNIKALYVGRIEKAKGIDIIIALAKKFPQVHFQCVGQILMDIKNCPTNITFYGSVSHEKIDPFYRDATLFLFPSMSEGSATVTQEALAYGLPGVVSFQAGSHYINNESGFVLDAQDFEGFEDALITLLTDQSLMMAFRVAAGKQAAYHTVDRYQKELVEAICSRVSISITPPTDAREQSAQHGRETAGVRGLNDQGRSAL